MDFFFIFSVPFEEIILFQPHNIKMCKKSCLDQLSNPKGNVCHKDQWVWQTTVRVWETMALVGMWRG